MLLACFSGQFYHFALLIFYQTINEQKGMFLICHENKETNKETKGKLYK